MDPPMLVLFVVEQKYLIALGLTPPAKQPVFVAGSTQLNIETLELGMPICVLIRSRTFKPKA